MLPPPPPVPTGERYRIEANLGATTQSNFYVGFSGEIAGNIIYNDIWLLEGSSGCGP